MPKRQPQQGVTLLELMLVLTIIFLILVVATRYYETTRSRHRVNEAVGMIQAVYAGAEAWLQDHADLASGSGYPSGASNLRDALRFINSLPDNFNQPNVNPWGGALDVTGGGTTVTIKMSGADPRDCQNVLDKLQQNLVVYDTKSTCSGNEEVRDLEVILDLARP